jgi:hypothetical protein
MAGGLLAGSCLLAGCDGGGTSTVSPEAAGKDLDVLKKWQEEHKAPVMKGKAPTSPTGQRKGGESAAAPVVA